MANTLVTPILIHQYAIIEKVDQSTRTVTGWAITEQPTADHQNDRVLFTAALDAFQKWASLLGIREMHQPKAVAKLVEWWPDEPNKRIGIRVQVSRSRDGDDVWTKITEGILRGFSIGGKALDYLYEGAIRVISKLRLIEISFVDVPADPAAIITFFKSDEVDIQKAVEDAPGLRHAEPVDYSATSPDEIKPPRQCSTCSTARYFDSVVYCRRYDFKTQGDWVCDGYELAQTINDPDADIFVPLAKTVQAAGDSQNSTEVEDLSMKKQEDTEATTPDAPEIEVQKGDSVTEKCNKLVKDAMALMDSDPAKAAGMLKDAAEALASSKQAEEDTSTPVAKTDEGQDTSETKTEEETETEAEAETEAEDDNDVQKAFAAIALLTSQVSLVSQGMQDLQKSLQAKPEAPAKPVKGQDTLAKADLPELPKGDLPTKTTAPVELDAVEKAIMAGDIDGAVTAAGSRGLPYVMDKMDTLVKKSLAEAGVGLSHAFILSEMAAK